MERTPKYFTGQSHGQISMRLKSELVQELRTGSSLALWVVERSFQRRPPKDALACFFCDDPVLLVKRLVIIDELYKRMGKSGSGYWDLPATFSFLDLSLSKNSKMLAQSITEAESKLPIIGSPEGRENAEYLCEKRRSKLSINVQVCIVADLSLFTEFLDVARVSGRISRLTYAY
jgi:hypothetical protein